MHVSVNVPVAVFLVLARLYRDLPQEKVDREVWFNVRALEQRAYRKMKHSKKGVQNG